MPRANRQTATSPQALIQAPPTAPGLASSLMGSSGSKDALAKLNSAINELKALAARPMLERALTALRAEDHQTAGEWAIKALEQEERNGFGWYLLGIARERAGDFASSVQAFEMALRLLPDQVEIANNLGRLAMRMGMKKQAEAFFRHYLVKYPNSAEAANNLGCALRDQGQHAEAIEVLRAAILASPEHAMLWSTLGTCLSDQGDWQTAHTFFQEALRIQPDFAKARYNLGNTLLALGDAEGALEACDTALAAVLSEDERQMMTLARSTILIALGRIGEGWDAYEARLSWQFADVTRFIIDKPWWEPGADVEGKHVLVVGEQGLGDEILFANTLPDLLEKVGPTGKVMIGVEPRLVALFQRSFPEAEVGAHKTYKYLERPARAVPFVTPETRVDLWAPIGCLLREHRRSVEAFPDRVGFLKADAERVAFWKAKVAAEAPAGPKIGLLWKSGILTAARRRLFSAFEQWAPVLTTPGCTFVNLQYGDCEEELELARKELGVEIWSPPEIDLKQDLDEVTALCGAMDLVVGFSNATFNLAAATGVPAWLITTPAVWPRLGTKDRYPWYPQVRVFAPESNGDWETVMGEVGEALASFAAA